MATSIKALDHYRMSESNQRPVAEKSSRSESAGWEAYRMSPALGEVSRLLAGWGGGDAAALDELIPLVYDELKRLGHPLMRRGRPAPTLQRNGLGYAAYI